MSVARFIADQRTFYRVPHAFTCRVLSVSESWFYKWVKAPPTARGARRVGLDEAVRKAFEESGARYGSPRVWEDLVDPTLPHPELIGLEPEQAAEPTQLPVQPDAPDLRSDGVLGEGPPVTGALPDALLDMGSGRDAGEQGVAWRVSVNTVADSMRRQGLKGRKVKRNKGLTRQDKKAPKFPDLLKRDFTAAAPNLRWVGDMTEIPTGEGRLYLATVIDLCSRRLLAAPTSEHPDADLACDAIRMAVAVRGGAASIARVIFHTDRGSTYTATSFTKLCGRLKIRQSMGRVGSCLDNAQAETLIGLYKAELVWHEGPWRSVDDLELGHRPAGSGGSTKPARQHRSRPTDRVRDRLLQRPDRSAGLMSPSRNDVETRATCPVCHPSFVAIRRQTYCTPACRQAAWRARNSSPDSRLNAPVVPAPGRPQVTVYACTECDQRYLGQQWCDDCVRPCVRVGLGGLCPHCDEPVAVDEILESHHDDLTAQSRENTASTKPNAINFGGVLGLVLALAARVLLASGVSI